MIINRYDLTTLAFVDQFDLTDLEAYVIVITSYVSSNINIATGGFIVHDAASQFGVQFPGLGPGDQISFTGFTDSIYNRTYVVESVDGTNQITFINPFTEFKSGEADGNVITMNRIGASFNQFADPDYGISVDDTSKVYAVDYEVSRVVRADIATLLGDGLSNGSFSNPTYSTIVEYSAPPGPPAEKIFGNIIW